MAARRAAVSLADIVAARSQIADVIRRTPVVGSRALSERVGGTVTLKAENLQHTGSFKLRGALNKVSALGEAAACGVVCASAGNHGQALAYAARKRGVGCEVFMPRDAPLSKVQATQANGAAVHLEGSSIEDCLELATARAAEDGSAFVHPFDDVDVIAGQGVVGLELSEDLGDLAQVIIPVGGGGLAAGVAIACKSKRPDIEVIGVQVESCPSFAESLSQSKPVAVGAGPTIADGIAVKRPGETTFDLISHWLDDIVVVSDDDVAEAMVLLLERAKLLAEGAGAVGVTALLQQKLPRARGTTAIIVSGGNVDAALLASIIRRHETEVGRRVRLFTRLPDTAGSLARLLTSLGQTGANLISVEHLREGVDLHVRESGVELVIGVRGPDHAAEALAAVRAAGYPAEILS